ncbi:hypothetical protein [Penaeicola halotolerans]|uniref:hypothetical protein n=1 Tax=Penaeicola halotolerans TaxID=2793196 RepID=UPI001CF8BDF1|nr:hypothetical protein [Penaeicola halotolerans]
MCSNLQKLFTPKTIVAIVFAFVGTVFTVFESSAQIIEQEEGGVIKKKEVTPLSEDQVLHMREGLQINARSADPVQNQINAIKKEEKKENQAKLQEPEKQANSSTLSFSFIMYLLDKFRSGAFCDE